jgi:hypothetical protein
MIGFQEQMFSFRSPTAGTPGMMLQQQQQNTTTRRVTQLRQQRWVAVF